MKNNPAGTAYSRSVIFIICLLICLTPLARGGMLFWAKTLIQLFVLAGWMLVTLESCFTGTRIRPASTLTWPLTGIALLALITALSSGCLMLSLEGLVMLYTYLALYYLTIAAIRTRKELRLLIGVMVFMAVTLSVFGLFKRYGFNPFPFWAYTPWYRGIPLTSVFPNHNHMAGLLEMVIPLLLVFIIISRESFSWRVFLAYLAIILLIAHLLTLSRGGWISLSVALIFLMGMFSWKRRMSFKWLGGILFIWVTFLMLSVFSFTPVSERILTMTEDSPALSMKDRVAVWDATLVMISDHPLTGTGPGTFAHRFSAYQPPGFAHRFTMAHNDYLHFIAETGVLLIPLLVWLIYRFFKRGFYLTGFKRRRLAGSAIGVMSAVIAVMIHSLVDFNLHIPANALIFSVLCATMEVHSRDTDET